MLEWTGAVVPQVRNSFRACWILPESTLCHFQGCSMLKGPHPTPASPPAGAAGKDRQVWLAHRLEDADD